MVISCMARHLLLGPVRPKQGPLFCCKCLPLDLLIFLVPLDLLIFLVPLDLQDLLIFLVPQDLLIFLVPLDLLDLLDLIDILYGVATLLLQLQGHQVLPALFLQKGLLDLQELLVHQILQNWWMLLDLPDLPDLPDLQA